MTASFAAIRALIARVPPLYRALNWWMVLDVGSALPTNPRLLPAHLRRFARRIHHVYRRDTRRRSRNLKRRG